MLSLETRTRLRPPKKDLELFGLTWADRMGYKLYTSGRLKTKHGIHFKNYKEVGLWMVRGGLIDRTRGGEYYIIPKKRGDEE